MTLGDAQHGAGVRLGCPGMLKVHTSMVRPGATSRRCSSTSKTISWRRMVERGGASAGNTVCGSRGATDGPGSTTAAGIACSTAAVLDAASAASSPHAVRPRASSGAPAATLPIT